jgi:hypothetical protein
MGSKVTGFDKGDMIVADVGSEYSDICLSPCLPCTCFRGRSPPKRYRYKGV